jgi:hypothetical protein
VSTGLKPKINVNSLKHGTYLTKHIIQPSPGGVMNVLLGLAKTIPSRSIPIPSLLALPSKPIETTILFL